MISRPPEHDDRALERSSKVTGGAAGKVVAKLLTEGLVEEIRSRGSLPVWHRHGDDAHTLRLSRLSEPPVTQRFVLAGVGQDAPSTTPLHWHQHKAAENIRRCVWINLERMFFKKVAHALVCSIKLHDPPIEDGTTAASTFMPFGARPRPAPAALPGP
jgi:hypothetical protein